MTKAKIKTILFCVLLSVLLFLRIKPSGDYILVGSIVGGLILALIIVPKFFKS